MRKKQKLTTLEALQLQTNTAIGFITSAIDSLKTISVSIADEQEKNTEEILKLQSTNNALSDLKSGNDRVISTFEKLLQ